MRTIKTLAVAAASVSAILMSATPPASAAATWNFPNGSFTLSDILGDQATLTISQMKVTGASASGYLNLSNGRYSCSATSFSGLTATFTLASYDPCYGTISFAIDSSGRLTVSGSSVYIPATLLTGPGTGSVQGTQPVPTVVPLTSCALTYDKTGPNLSATWAANPDAVSYDVAVSGGGDAAVSGLTKTSVSFDTSVISLDSFPGTWEVYTATVTAKRADGATVATCSVSTTLATPNAPVIDSTVPVPAGGLLTVNYSLPTPYYVQGVEYQIDGGPWVRPGGTAPGTGSGGAFTISGITARKLMLTLRAVGTAAEGGFVAVGTPEPVVFAAAPSKGPSGSSRPTQGSGPAIGSTVSNPVAVPPAQPASSVGGTSNGVDAGVKGALAADTGDAGIDAPCLAPDGTLYPTLYSTVGSQLTMAPNTHGMGSAESFTVVGGALAPGLLIDRTYGVVFGVPTQAGSWTTTVRAKFADGTFRDAQFSTRVDEDAQWLQYAAQNIGSVGAALRIAPSSNAPVAGTTYRLVCGILPAGTTLDAKTGQIVGTPETVVDRPIPLRVAETSSAGKSAASFIFVVDRAGTQHLHYPSHPHARVGKPITIRPTVSGVGEIVQFRTSVGKLPKGLRLNPQTGVITGRVAHAGPHHTITLVAVTKGGALLTAAPMKLSVRR
ncbi:MAG: putative Ig domain-containing protein [Actinomycetales bacterium]